MPSCIAICATYTSGVVVVVVVEISSGLFATEASVYTAYVSIYVKLTGSSIVKQDLDVRSVALIDHRS